jgi:putative endonuclease
MPEPPEGRLDTDSGGTDAVLYYAYLLECADGTLYAGWTLDLEKRLLKHNRGLGAKYTRSRCPVRLLKAWPFPTRRKAMQFEARLKRLPRAQKRALALADASVPD